MTDIRCVLINFTALLHRTGLKLKMHNKKGKSVAFLFTKIVANEQLVRELIFEYEP